MPRTACHPKDEIQHAVHATLAVCIRVLVTAQYYKMAQASGRDGGASLKQRLEQILGLGSPRAGGAGQMRAGEDEGLEGGSDNSRFFTEDVMKVRGRLLMIID